MLIFLNEDFIINICAASLSVEYLVANENIQRVLHSSRDQGSFTSKNEVSRVRLSGGAFNRTREPSSTPKIFASAINYKRNERGFEFGWRIK